LYALRWIAYASLYLVVWYSSIPALWWLWGLYGTGLLIGGIGVAQYIWYPYLRNLSYLGWDPHLYRVFSTLFDPNFAAVFFVATLFLGALLWHKTNNKWLLVVGQSLSLLVLFLTYSRSGYLAFIAGILVCAWCLRNGRAAVMMIFGFLLLLFFLPHPAGEGVKLFRTVSTFARLGNWQRGTVLIAGAPVFGYGFDLLRYEQHTRGWIDERTTPSKAGAGLDNSLQFVWATTGIM
jgi:hypothetical protein